MQSQLWPVARRVFITALLLFVVTIVIGILNGTDLYFPGRDALLTHVHSGTLGWITLSVSGVALLMLTEGRALSVAEVKQAGWMAWSIIGAIVLYVFGGFLTGGHLPSSDSDAPYHTGLGRPIFGTLLFIVIIWYLVWIVRNYRADGARSTARLGLLLAWIALLIGAVFGVLLGIFTSQGKVPGLSAETSQSLADAHPPAMVIGYLILAAMAVIEWLFRGDRSRTKGGDTQMWLLFAAGIIANVAFISGADPLLGLANLLMIVGVVMLVVRSWEQLKPSGWKGSGTGAYPRVSSTFLVVYLILGTVLISLFISGAMDIDSVSDAQEGLLLTFDHSMFVGVMTMLLFGVVSSRSRGRELSVVDRIVLWGVPIGLVTFAVGLMTVHAVPKRIGTPIMGTSLLIGIGYYVWTMATHRSPTS